MPRKARDKTADTIRVDEETGEKYLVQNPARAAAWADKGLDAARAAHQALVDARLEAARAKAASTSAKGLPPEKSPL